jgi:parvulin-like peptidyl-prolyl isomerase
VRKPLDAARLTVGAALALFASSALVLRAADAPKPARAPAQPAAATQGPVVAQVGNAAVTLDQLQKPLIQAYGLNILLNLVQLEVAKENAAKAGVTVTPDDVARETQITIDRMFEQSNEKLVDRARAARDKGDEAKAKEIEDQIKTDNAKAFEQFLQNQRITRAEFDIVTETNAYLRKIAEPMLAGKITDEALQEAFKSLYGETVKARHIQCDNMQEILKVQERLKSGEPFEKVAREMSRNKGTASMGGMLPPFSRNTQGLPEAFKQAAFSLKPGERSEAVSAEGGYHIIQLDERIAPKAVKYEDVKESLRKDVNARAVDAAVKSLRQQLGNQAVQNLVISDPELKKQWQAKLDARDKSKKDAEEAQKQRDAERERAATQPVAPLLPDLAPPK